MEIAFALVHVDDALIVADKPAGLLAVPGRGAEKADCLAARVQARCADARVVHRLDMATSGLMVLARGAAMQRELAAAFAERRVTKTYVAVVHGLLADEAGEVDLALRADWTNRPRQRVDRLHGKPSRTRWRVLSRDAHLGRTRLSLQPLTGRTHQLRVHLAAIGHPIVGDALYVDSGAAEGSSTRLLLHATTLGLDHPVHGLPIGFRSPVPF